MGDEHLDTIQATKSDEFIKSGVETLILIPSESEGIPDHMCDVPFHDNLRISLSLMKNFLRLMTIRSLLTTSNMLRRHLPILSSSAQRPSLPPLLSTLLEETNNFDNSLTKFTTFSKVLCDAEYESDSSDDQSCSDEDVLEKIVSKPMSEEEIIPMESLRTHDSSLPISSKIDSLLDEFAGELTLLKSIPLGIDETDYFMQKLTITLASHQEKSPDLLSHQGETVKKFNTHRSHLNICPILFHGQNNPPLDVLLFHFIPLDSLKYGGNMVQLI
nr:hypothetical protein [Tanacetum cinerariifolium]